MKERGSLSHTKLAAALATQLAAHFVPEVPLVRRCIEWLIDKEYLARHVQDRDVYVYVA